MLDSVSIGVIRFYPVALPSGSDAAADDVAADAAEIACYVASASIPPSRLSQLHQFHQEHLS